MGSEKGECGTVISEGISNSDSNLILTLVNTKSASPLVRHLLVIILPSTKKWCAVSFFLKRAQGIEDVIRILLKPK